MMKKIFSAILLAALLFSIFAVALPVDAVENNDNEENVHTLYAGQDLDVGTVTVSNDENYLYVNYELNQDAIGDGWVITEVHVHVGESLDDFPLAGRWGNPVPGQFDYKESVEFDEGKTEWLIEIPLDDWEAGDELLVAAHAVIEREECEVLAKAPYGGSEVVDTFQAWRIDHTPEAPRYVREQRSDPDNALEVGTPGEETFYSLGYGGVLNAEGTAVETFFGEYFEDRRDPDAIREMEAWVDEDLAAKLSDTENNAGWIIIEFDPTVLNVEGENDIQVVEDTWGLPYPLELAAVFARADVDDDWTFLFLAHNQDPDGDYHTVTDGSLGDLDEAVQILVQDVSDPEWFIPYPHSVETLDGFDLNAVVALNDHEICERFDETAWADGTRFTEQGNWATYVEYTVQGEIEIEYPEGGSTTVAFEDGTDYDYNDFVVAIDTKATFWGTTEDKGLMSLEFTFIPLSRGATYEHMFGMKFPADTFASDGQYTLRVYDGNNYLTDESIGNFDAADENDFTILEKTSDALPDMSNHGYPHDEPPEYVETNRIVTLKITFDENEPFELGTIKQEDFTMFHGEELFFEPFLVVEDTGEEIYPGDTEILTVPADWKWPIGGIHISDAYYDVDALDFPSDWWLDYDEDLVYAGHLE